MNEVGVTGGRASLGGIEGSSDKYLGRGRLELPTTIAFVET